MAASATNTSRELGAVGGVAVLGAIVNAQLTTNLSHRLAAIGIPSVFRATVITAVTTGTVRQQAAGITSKSIQKIVDQVENQAYGAFSHGLHICLLLAGALMLASSFVALATMRRSAALPDDASGGLMGG
jgi:uncharacterized protein with gpF-like domain